jgi:ribosomal protein S18 acetylase RimI-like enzyme
MFEYRRFRNTDPPALVEVWNESLANRGAFPLRTAGVLERWLFSKPYFRHDALIVAETGAAENRKVVGWVLAGPTPTSELNAINPEVGVICLIVVRPEFRRQGVGRELARRAEQFLQEHGAKRIIYGSQAPNNPYLFGLYGGSNSPGILDTDQLAAPFLQALGCQRAEERLIFQKSLDAPLSVADARFGMLRRRYEAQFVLRGATAGSWWQECLWGTLEPSELRVFDRLTGMPAARAVVWELEGFSWRWGGASAGIFDVQVRPDLRRQGIAKLVLLDILRFLQEQFFGLVELHSPKDCVEAVGLARSLGFEQVDTGAVWEKR